MLTRGCSYFPLGRGYLSLILCPLPKGLEGFSFVMKKQFLGGVPGSTHGEANDQCINQRMTHEKTYFFPVSFLLFCANRAVCLRCGVRHRAWAIREAHFRVVLDPSAYADFFSP